MWSPLHSKRKRNISSIWRCWNFFRRSWYRSTAFFVILVACAGLDVKKGGSTLHIMCVMLHAVSGLHWQHNRLKWENLTARKPGSDHGLSRNFGGLLEKATCTEEATLCNKLPETEKRYVQRWILLYCGKTWKVESCLVGSPKMLKKLQKDKLNLVNVQR